MASVAHSQRSDQPAAEDGPQREDDHHTVHEPSLDQRAYLCGPCVVCFSVFTPLNPLNCVCVCARAVSSAEIHGGSLHSPPHHPGPDRRQRDVGGREGEEHGNTDPCWSLLAWHPPLRTRQQSQGFLYEVCMYFLHPKGFSSVYIRSLIEGRLVPGQFSDSTSYKPQYHPKNKQMLLMKILIKYM